MADVIDQLRRHDFIIDQLSRYAGQKKQASNRILVLCPFHSEKTPSGSIWVGNDRFIGNFRCFGCGKRTNWDDLAPRIGLQPFKRGKPQEETSIDLGMDRLMNALLTTERYVEKAYNFGPIPPNRIWRSIPTNLLIEVGGQMCSYQGWDENNNWTEGRFLYFPVVINGEKHGYFVARKKKHPDLSSYLLAAGNGSGWSSTHGLWPFHFALDLMRKMRSHSIVLVEGQRDALRLLNYGIPAVCIFGTQSWKSQKARLLEIAGVEHVILMMDGDNAGISATQRIAPMLEETFEDVSVIKLWAVEGSPYKKFAHLPEPSKAAKRAGVDLYDPGNVPVTILDRLKRKFF
jgi:5S rRNA maturation endonuclease (ribonuclease M5)